MRPRVRIFGTALLLFTTGCGGSEESDRPQGEGESPSTAEAMVSTGPVRIAGELLVGENTVEFTPCDGGDVLWLDGPLVTDLVSLHGELTPGVEPFEAIFIDVVADIGPPPATGPGQRFPGALIVHLLRRAAYEGAGCGGVDPDLVLDAGGTEPFWSLRWSSEEATFATPEQRRILDLGPLSVDDEGWVVQGVDPDGQNVFLSLTETPCRNAMSGAYAHLTAELQIEGRRLQGCAVIGAAADPDAG